jgi:hypothetical protein
MSQVVRPLPARGQAIVEATNRDTWNDDKREICIGKIWTACLVCWGGPLDVSIVESKYRRVSRSDRGKQTWLWIPIELWIGSQRHPGKLRYGLKTQDSCISNDLDDGFKLGPVMTAAGFAAKEKIYLKVIGNEVHVLRAN